MIQKHHFDLWAGAKFLFIYGGVKRVYFESLVSYLTLITRAIRVVARAYLNLLRWAITQDSRIRFFSLTDKTLIGAGYAANTNIYPAFMGLKSH